MNEVPSRILYRIFLINALELLLGRQDKFRNHNSNSRLKKYSEKLSAAAEVLLNLGQSRMLSTHPLVVLPIHIVISVNQGFHALKAQESEILMPVRASGSQLYARNDRAQVRGQKCSELMESLVRVTPHRHETPVTHLFCPYHNNVILQKFLE